MQKKRIALVVAAVMAAVLVPAVCQAGIFDCFNKSSAEQAPLSYAPLYGVQRVSYMPTAGVCDPCAQPQMTYVPQVKYKWKYSRIERTEYEPVATCDPCSGTPVTSYRPVTKKSMLPWLHREAYTTYKAVPVGGATPVSFMQPQYNPCAVPCNPCDPCGNVCDPCGGAMAAPSLNSGCSTCVGSSTATVDPYYDSSSGQTFSGTGNTSDNWSGRGEVETLKPQPDPAVETTEELPKETSNTMPQLIIPTGRTASVSTSAVRTISYDAPATLRPVKTQQRVVRQPLNLVPVQVTK